MRQQDIDKKIGMPDVDKEWARFEREVIGTNSKSRLRHAATWTIVIGIAAAILLLFVLNTDMEKVTEGPIGVQKVAMNSQQENTPTSQQDDNVMRSDSLITPRQLPARRPRAELLAQATPPSAEAKVYDCGEIMPQFPGGDRALMEFIRSNIRYPDLAMEYGARGRVITTFKIDSLGYASDFKVAKIMKLEYDTLRLSRESADRQQQLRQEIERQLGDESLRILSLMPRWTPGSQFGRSVSMKYGLPVPFRATEEERQVFLAQRQSEELQDRIAGLTIVPSSADMGPNAMRLNGIRVTGTDSVRIGRKSNYDFLVVVNGQPLSETEQKQMLSSDLFVYFYNRQQLIDSIWISKDEDAKRPYVEKFGERAKNAVMFIATVADTLCDAYVQQHPGLMKTRHRTEGYVIDHDTGKPLPDTWISYKDVADNSIIYTEGAGAATDSTGHFILWLPRKDVKLQASRAGYGTVRINQPADTTLTIRMKDMTSLKEVKVNPRAIMVR